MPIPKSPIVQGKIRSRKLDNLEKHLIPSKEVGKAQDSTKPESRIASDAVGSSVSNDNLEKTQSGVTLPGPFEQRLDRNTERQIQKLHAPQPSFDPIHCRVKVFDCQ